MRKLALRSRATGRLQLRGQPFGGHLPRLFERWTGPCDLEFRRHENQLIGAPLTQEIISLATKFPNLYIDTSAYKATRSRPTKREPRLKDSTSDDILAPSWRSGGRDASG